MSKNTELEALLNFDPIAVAEELTGERRTDASNMLGLVLAVNHHLFAFENKLSIDFPCI